jgi:outer membrane immunogenic protein
MKRVALAVTLSALAGSAALAADLPPPMAPLPRAPAVYVPTPVPYYNWTGFYIGGNLGFGMNSGSFSDPAGNTFSSANNFKFLGGGQVGANYEFGNGVLIGVEAMFDWLPNNSNTVSATLGAPFTAGTAGSVTLNNSWLTTVTGRLGYAWDRVLIYGKGGGAWVGASNSNVTIGGVGVQTSGSNWGWTAGAGLEYAFWGNWSARVEYDYIGLTSQSFAVPAIAGVLPAPGDQFSGSNRNIQMVTLGINYKFGW